MKTSNKKNTAASKPKKKRINVKLGHILITGKKCTGKTSFAKWILEGIKRDHPHQDAVLVDDFNRGKNPFEMQQLFKKHHTVIIVGETRPVWVDALGIKISIHIRMPNQLDFLAKLK